MAYSNKFFEIGFDEKEYGIAIKAALRFAETLDAKREIMKCSEIDKINELVKELGNLIVEGYLFPKQDSVKSIKSNAGVVEFIKETSDAVSKAKEIKEQLTAKEKKDNDNKND